MQNMTITILTLATLMLAVFAAGFYSLKWLPEANGAARSLFKTLPVTLLAIAALSGGGPGLLVVALVLSATGDFFLSREGEASFLAGLGSFLIAHLVFIGLFLTHSTPPLPGQIVLTGVWVGTLVLVALILFSLWPHLAKMKIPVFIYAIAIGAMNISAWGSGQEKMLLAGVALFVFSDAVLAHELFVWKHLKTKLTASYAVWFSYFTAQALILVSFI